MTDRHIAKDNLENWQLRVVIEGNELLEKLAALRRYIDSKPYEDLDHPDMRLLILQEKSMSDYSEVLTQRINKF